MHDYDIVREQLFTAFEDIALVLSRGDDVNSEHLERLVRDRDEMLTMAHFSVGIPVLELARRTGIGWPNVYAIVDRVRAEKLKESRKRNGWPSLVPTPLVDTPIEPETDGGSET